MCMSIVLSLKNHASKVNFLQRFALFFSFLLEFKIRELDKDILLFNLQTLEKRTEFKDLCWKIFFIDKIREEDFIFLRSRQNSVA